MLLSQGRLLTFFAIPFLQTTSSQKFSLSSLLPFINSPIPQFSFPSAHRIFPHTNSYSAFILRLLSPPPHGHSCVIHSPSSRLVVETLLPKSLPNKICQVSSEAHKGKKRISGSTRMMSAVSPRDVMAPPEALPVLLPAVEGVRCLRKTVPVFGCGGRVRIAALFSRETAEHFIGKRITICGWSRSVRKQGGGNICFVVLSDGSTPQSLQVVVSSTIGNSFQQLLKCGVGCSFRFTGEIVKSPAKGQAVEMIVEHYEKGDRIEVLGYTDPAKYPLAKKEHTREFLREIAHLRPRSHLIGAVTRVRSQLAMATHSFFQEKGFLYIHTPIITASDCEGAGEMFQVTTLLPSIEEADSTEACTNGVKLENAAAAVNVGQNEKKKQLLPTTRNGKVDYSKDFFGRPAFLTVSGQLAVEPFCCSLSDVYTFGPTFRAENSHTSRHLAEFWMVEPEMAFATLEDNMDVAEDYVKYCVQWVLDNCKADIEWFAQNQEEELENRLQQILSDPFGRLSYTEAIELLKRESDVANFKEPVYWGMDLGSEHERYLTEKIVQKPCIVYNYPKEIKAFYMKLNTDGKTVRAMDVLVPKIGELVGGSQREDDLARLDAMIISKKLNPEDYWWYRELRSYGTVPHAGFGLGFERLVMLVTGIENIRDTLPYPRYPGHAEF